MSKKGTSTFIIQRASAVLLVPLGAWLLFSIVSVLGADYAGAQAWLSQPLNGAFFAAFVVIGAWHMRIGMAEIILDYVYSWAKDVLLFLNWIIAIGLIAFALFAVYSVSFAG